MRIGKIFQSIVKPCLLIVGCQGGNARQILGINKQPPDEFKVVSNPPLSLPPNFSVRPPEEITKSSKMVRVFEKASSEFRNGFPLGYAKSL